MLLPLLLLLAGGVARAQSPLNVTIAVLPPYSPDLSVWLANPNRILITVQNQDLNRGYDFRLAGFAENTDGSTRIETKDEYPIAALRIEPGAVRTLNLNDFKIFDGNAVRFKGADKDLIGRTKLLPEGVYRVCVRALEFKTLAPLSPQEPSGCATFVVRTADEPEPLQPTCGQFVKATKPQLVQFQWTVPPGAPPGTQYRFKMVPIVKGQSPQQAMKSATSPAFFEQTANGPILLYGPADPPLVPGGSYAWQVQAVDPSGNLVFRNNGVSDVCSFQWQSVVPLVNDSVTVPITITDKPIDITDGITDLPISPDSIGIKKLDTMLFIKADELGKTFGCVKLTPLAAKQPEVGQRTMQFAGYAEPGINLDAVTGAEVEVFLADRRSLLPYDLVGSKSQPVFSRRLKGSVAAGILLTKGKGVDRTHFELAFANGPDGFIPKKGVDYAWRFTLEFNGKTIRNDGVACTDKRATSVFERFPDLIIAKKLPDTLIAGGFTIVVEDWDASSKSVDPSRPSGIGRVKFDCNGGKKPKPWWFGNIGVIRKNFDVVGAVSDSATELAVSEAIYVEPTVKIGDVVALDLPAGSVTSLAETVVNRNAILDLFKKNVPDGIRVAFRDVTWDSPTDRTEVLTDGIAIYPSSSPVPTPPAEVVLDSAFTLAIDSLIIRPASASVKGAVLLPTSIISNDTCTRARLPLPMTTITSTCEFYQEVADANYGQWYIGETGLLVFGKGYTLDFSSAQSPAGPAPPLAASWKGVKLNSGTTPDPPSDSVISNRGYVKAKYTFANGLITGSGFAARLNFGGGFVYHALDPFGYQINLSGSGYLRLAKSAIENGEFNNSSIRLPRVAISTGGSSIARVDVFNVNLKVQPDQDLFADLLMKDNLAWGEFSKAGPKRYYAINGSATDIPAHFYLGARWMAPFYPLTDTTYTTPTFAPATTQLEAQRMQGVTIPRIHNVPLMIATRDRPDPNEGLKFPAETVVGIWMNIVRTGVHTEVSIRAEKERLGEIEMGPVWETGPAYAGEAPFKTLFGYDPKKKEQNRGIMRFQFVESAVWHSTLHGSVKLPMPVAAEIDFKQMMFTSTAECSGGQVDLSQPDTMAYWGVGLVPKDPTKSAGILCVKLGVIYLTAAGFNEPRHFAKPFYLVWGEMKASGNMGRLVFDYNSVGQKFDRFGFSPELVKLSPYVPTDSGHVLAYGSVAINFFGSKKLSIVDYKSLKLNNPFNGRFVRVLDTAYMGAPASQLEWQRNWGDGIANLEYDSIRYHVDRQDGFFGSGEVSLFNITGGMYSTIDIAAEGICFRVMEESAHTFALGPVAQMSAMGNIWGCGCIVGESLEKIAIGGEASSSLGLGFSIAARGANMVSMIMSYSPTRFVMEANGAMFVNVGAVDLEVTGLASFTVERGEEMFVEGYFRGTVNLGAVIAGVEGEGEFDWHLGTDYQSVQGRVAVRIWGYMGGVGAQTGIFFGHNVPKERVWVMDGINGRFGLNKGGLPARLTGFYAFLNVEASVSFYFLASGGFQLYVGVGAFVSDSPFIGGTPVPGLAFPYFVGNVGVRIWGEILGGLVSAAAWGNLQFTGALPPAFEGTIGLEGCVLWVLCGSVDITCGYNRTDGFYMH
ncbi:MAG: hypothetical protein UZ07_CHB004001363 [Chlorobi bacterium OLB7]|nr:MAG: hypothetical protein UZ07_CHB004001363 [Chlorobi bacterium OLB7]